MAARPYRRRDGELLACEFHANDVPWWDDLIISRMRKPLIQNGFIEVPDLRAWASTT